MSKPTIVEVFDYADPNHPTEFWRKKRAKLQLKAIMLDMLPKQYNTDNTMDEFKAAYNQAIQEMREKIEEAFKS